MKIKKSDLKIETMRGQGPGGQHRNKTDSAVRITHIPTGVSAIVDGRSQHKNKRAAIAEIARRIEEIKERETAEARKARRDTAIQPSRAVRTYDYKSGVVTDHRTGKKASIKDVLGKGKIDLLK